MLQLKFYILERIIEDQMPDLWEHFQVYYWNWYIGFEINWLKHVIILESFSLLYFNRLNSESLHDVMIQNNV